MQDTMIGVDLAKNVFQLHGATMTGQLKFRKKLTRPQFQQFMSDQPSAMVVMEACGSASYWAREMIKLGHEVRLIAPQYVRPFVKRQKNDTADAEAIVIAAQRPEMRFVEPKSEDQQARAVLFRARERLVRQRTELTNALRGVLYEYGYTVPQGIRHLKRIEAILDENNSSLPVLVREECRDLMAQITEKTADRSQDEESKEVGGADQHGASVANYAWCRPHDRACDRGLCSGNEELPTRTGLWRLVGTCAAPALFGRQRSVGAYIKGRSGRHSTPADHWRNVPAKLDRAQVDPGGFLARANAIKKATNVGRDRIGQQDGARSVGHADEKRELSRSDLCKSRCSVKNAAASKAQRSVNGGVRSR